MNDVTHAKSTIPFYIARESTYGVMTPVVQQFLSRLTKLPLADWISASVRSHDAVAREIPGLSEDDRLAAAARARLRAVMNDMPAALSRAKRRVHDIADVAAGMTAEAVRSPMTRAAITAVLALIARPHLSAQEFQRLYAPFADIIPVSSLERASNRSPGGPLA